MRSISMEQTPSESLTEAEAASKAEAQSKILEKIEDFEEAEGLTMPSMSIGLALTLDIFVFDLQSEAFALTSATGGLLAPFPAGIQTFDEPEIDDGVFVGTKVLDGTGALVGFGSEQEILDTATALADTTFTLTLPNRGTLMLDQDEDFADIFAEIDDMVATSDFVRAFSPPLVVVTTVPGSGKVLGGTDSFAGASGYMVEIDFIHEINLLNGTADITDVLLVGYN